MFVCAFFVSIFNTRRPQRVPSTISTSSSSSARASLVSSVKTTCQDTSHEATLPGQARGQARVTPTSNRLQPSLHAVKQYCCFRVTPRVRGRASLLLPGSGRCLVKHVASSILFWYQERGRAQDTFTQSQESDHESEPMSQPNSAEEPRSQFHPTGRKEKNRTDDHDAMTFSAGQNDQMQKTISDFQNYKVVHCATLSCRRTRLNQRGIILASRPNR